MVAQSYVNKFEIMPAGFNEPFTDLNTWRGTVGTTHAQYGSYNKCWSEVLSGDYHFTIPQDYRWITVNQVNAQTQNKVVIHRSKHRHNGAFPWSRLLSSIPDEVMFVTTDMNEWNLFPYKYGNVKLHLVNTITEMAAAINSSRLFIGNQSAPFSLASSLDAPRLVELDYDPCAFYMDERKYSSNISWFLNDSTKFFTHNFPIKGL